MKFSAITLLAFATSAAAIPEGFVEQCCTQQFARATGQLPFSFPDAYPTPAMWQATTQNHISGYNAEDCLAPMPGCISLLDVCNYFSYEGGVYPGLVGSPGMQMTVTSGRQTGVMQEGSAGLLCCPIDDPDCEEVEPLDNPWTCATSMRWGPPSDDAFKSGPDATSLGYYCGRTNICKTLGATCGDPHFQTFSGEWYDFHGECDMNFLEVPDFGKGLGMSVHIRTKARYEYSYVESAAIKIGDDVLEVSAYGQYFLNGVESADMTRAKMAGLFEIEHEIKDEKHHVYTIYTGKEQDGKAEAIQIKTFKDLVAVKMDNAYATTFANSRGMMGDFEEGKMLARDGKTVISDPVEFGMEWQVRAEESNLFQTASPIAGKCVMPSKQASAERRRLGEAVPLEAAVAACEAVDTIHHENCVYDVMATGDLEIAHAGVF